MADLEADVLPAIADIATSAAYPNGTAAPSISGAPIQIVMGWPKANALEAFLKPGGVAGARGGTMVSVYAVPGTSSDPGQVFDWQPGTISAPEPGLMADVVGQTITFIGTPNAGDNVVVTASGQAYGYTAQQGDTAQGVAALLAAQIPGAIASGSALTVPASSYGLTASLGASGVLGERLYRQRIQIMVVIWAPNQGDRATIAAAVDVALKRNITLTMPDSSEAIVVYQGTRLSDGSELEGQFRRDLLFQVTWDTIDTYAATEIVTTSAALAPT